jgi:Tfp pilus assembly protein PilF
MVRSSMLSILMLAVAGASLSATTVERAGNHVASALEGHLQPEHFHHLQLAFLSHRELPDWTVTQGWLDRLAADRRADPLMADEVRLLRARFEIDRGHSEAARELFRSMGGLSQFWITDPGNLDELEDFPSAASLPGGDVAWRPAAGTDPMGWVRLAGLVWPARRQMVYLGSTVTSSGERPVAIRVGAAQVARVWLNGELVLTTPRPLDHAEDQAAGGAWLRAGDNSLVVAVASESDDWWLRVRITDPDGGRLAGIGEAPRPPATLTPVERRPPDVRTLEQEIREAVDAGRPGARTSLAAFLVLRHPQAVGAGEAIPACRLARTESPGEARLLEWTLTSDPAAARELLEGSIRAEPDLHQARIELARWYAERSLHDLAAKTLEPHLEEPAVRATSLDLEAGLWGPIAVPALEELSQSWPRCLLAATVLVDRALSSNRWVVAHEALGRLEALAPDAPATLELADRVASDCGDGARLREILEQLLAADPNRPEVRVRLARLRLADDEAESAVGLLADGLARSPDDVELMMESARLEYAAGEDERAAALARRILELRPQDRRAQRLLERLGEGGDDRGWLRSPDELRALADDAPDGDPGVVLLTHSEIRFLPGNLTEERVQEAILVTSEDRADGLRTYPLPYVAESQRLRVLEARVIRPNGTESAARQSDSPRLSEPEYNLYYDTRMRLLRFPELEPGDLLEIAWVRSETVEANETGPYKGGLLRLGRSMPIVRAEVVLVGPEAALPQWQVVRLPDEPQRETAADGMIHVSWSWRDLPAGPADVPSPPPLATMPFLVYSNHPDWGDLADWYARHIAPRIKASRLVEETAERLTDGVTDRLDRISRLYRFVTNEIRYVGLEFGEHRFRPYSAEWVLNHRIGDCKDKATLLVALCDAAGISARFVMIRTADLGPVDTDIALLEGFNHAIVYLPDDDLWLDGTAAGHAMFPPPGMDQNAWVMVIDGRDSRPQTTPVVGGGLERHRYRLQRVGETGDLELEVRLDDSGEAADRRRGQFAGSQDSRRVSRWLQDIFPGAELASEPTLQMVPSRDPTLLEVTARVPRSAVASGGGIRTFPGDVGWLASLSPRGPRRSPLVVPVRPDLEWELDVDLGRAPGPLIDGLHLDGAYGSLRLEVEPRDTGYRIHGFLHIAAGLLAAGDTPGLRDFLVEVERTLARPLEIP